MEDGFTKLVQKYAKSLENYTIFNASSEHAIVLFKNLLEVAARERKPVKIFSGCFHETIYNYLLAEIRKVKDAKVEVALISECEASELQNNQFVNEIRNYQHGKVISLGQKVGMPHFILVGDSSYRVELDDGLRRATANFGDPAIGSTLNTFYHKLIELAQPTTA